MPQITDHTPGDPCWVDLGSPDVSASAEFYGQLFGWEAEDLGPDAGHYTLLRLQGRQVAAVGPLQGEGQPPAWTTYIATSDADLTTKEVTNAGGQVLVPPMDVMTAGRMAVYLDPTGAAFSVWQPCDHRGAELVGEPGPGPGRNCSAGTSPRRRLSTTPCSAGVPGRTRVTPSSNTGGAASPV